MYFDEFSAKNLIIVLANENKRTPPVRASRLLNRLCSDYKLLIVEAFKNQQLINVAVREVCYKTTRNLNRAAKSVENGLHNAMGVGARVESKGIDRSLSSTLLSGAQSNRNHVADHEKNAPV